MYGPHPEVAVVGAGIIGTSIAWRLAQGGCRVSLLDSGSVGGEASWAGAGMLAPGGEVDHRSEWADMALESLRMYIGFIDELQQESGCSIDYQRLGAVEVALTAEEFDRLTRRAEVQSGLGIESQGVDRAALRELLPLLDTEVAGARFFPADALVNPRHITRALATVCRKLGADIHERRAVRVIRARADRIEIETDAGPLTTDRAVLAAGAWSSEIEVWREGERIEIPRSFPVKGHLLGYMLGPGSLGPIVRHTETYLLQRDNGFTIAGTSVERVGFDRRIDPQIVSGIHRRAASLLPRLNRVPPPDPWVGFRPATDALDPEVRQIGGSGLWLSYGHYRNGILLAPATADRVSREILA